MDLQRAYTARGLPFERTYDGTEYWSDEEDEAEKKRQEEKANEGGSEDAYSDSDSENAKATDNRNRKYVNDLAEENAKKTIMSPVKANEMKFVAPPKYARLHEHKAEKTEYRIPLPYISAHIEKTLGEYTIGVIWDEFISHGATGTSCTQKKNIESIGKNTCKKIGRDIPFRGLNFDLEDDDYVPFIDVLEQLSVLINAPCDDYLEKEPPVRLPSCCAFRACRKHRPHNPDEKEAEADEELVPPFFLETIYTRWKLDKGGNLRRKHVPGILTEADIPYDTKRLPPLYWELYEDLLLEDSTQLMVVVEAIRIDMDMHREMKLDLFRLPRWVKNEFSISEIKLFIHHFKSIDIDGGGSIDAEELLKLTESLGSKITLDEAQELIDENDEDGSGTIDFEEFMILMFRIQHGTVDLENNRLGRAIMESKTQLAILQEIDEIQKNPPLPEVTVGKYGGCPVICEYLVEGPAGTVYEGGVFTLVVRYNPGYPYNFPTVTVGTRIYCINIMTKINGDGVLDHLPRTWDCNWNSKKLILHFYALLQEQDYSLIPTSLYNVAYSYFEQPEFKDDGSESSSLVSSKVDALKFPDLFDQLARIEQVQVNNIILHMGDRERYNDIARMYTKKFALSSSICLEERDHEVEGKSESQDHEV